MGAGAYTNTAEGKVVAAALLDNYNNIVKSIRTQPSLIASTATPVSQKNAADSVQANAFRSGDILKGKIGGVKVLASSDSAAKVVFTLKKEEEVVFLGSEKNGYLKVQGASGEGWVDKRLIK